MVKCHLSRLMGEHRVNITELAEKTGLHRNTITLLFHEKAKRIDLDALETLCNYFNCNVSDMLEILNE